MKSSISGRITRPLLAVALLMGAASVQAASGVSITRSQEGAVTIGMSTTDVRQILGRPAEVFKFRSARGESWIYRLTGAYGTVDFDVEFGSDGTVISARERAVPRG